jgi:hypothetical protein
MNQVEAIGKAKAFVSEHTGVDADPRSASLIRRSGLPSYWSIVYPAELFFPKDAAKGARVDGPYVIHVDDTSGEVSVLG